MDGARILRASDAAKAQLPLLDKAFPPVAQDRIAGCQVFSTQGHVNRRKFKEMGARATDGRLARSSQRKWPPGVLAWQAGRQTKWRYRRVEVLRRVRLRYGERRCNYAGPCSRDSWKHLLPRYTCRPRSRSIPVPPEMNDTGSRVWNLTGRVGGGSWVGWRCRATCRPGMTDCTD